MRNIYLHFMMFFGFYYDIYFLLFLHFWPLIVTETSTQKCFLTEFIVLHIHDDFSFFC